jgi:hypothetical protein
MKHLRETFTDEEWQRLEAYKKGSGKNWHDFLLTVSAENDMMRKLCQIHDDRSLAKAKKILKNE